MNDFVSFSIDTDTYVVVGMLTPNFLSRGVPAAPHVLSWLALARLHGISRAEVDNLLRERRRPPRRNADAESLRRELLALTA